MWAVTVLLLSLVHAVRFKDCGTEGILIKNIDGNLNFCFENFSLHTSVTPCPVEPCELHKNHNYSITVNFNEPVNDELSLSLCGYVGPVCVPFPTDTPKQKGC